MVWRTPADTICCFLNALFNDSGVVIFFSINPLHREHKTRRRTQGRADYTGYIVIISFVNLVLSGNACFCCSISRGGSQCVCASVPDLVCGYWCV